MRERAMTINMPDSITPENMPRGYPAYLAYVDGQRSSDADQVRALFAGARILTLTVLGGAAVADGCDREPGDLSPLGAAVWLRGRVMAGARRPVLYDSRDDIPETLGILAEHGVQRPQVRVWSAHYGAGRHICSPAACGATFTADGTQWTSTFPGAGGAAIDMSVLADDFFGTPAPPTTVNWTETLMQQLPELRQGATGTFVRTAQFQLGERGHKVAVDGAFGGDTLRALKACQAAARTVQDGVIGPVTWSALFGVQ
jgi:peptidoglycan hydrolase-like protein with peptidoglycan-binding domain